MSAPLERLRHHVTGAIERGESVAVVGVPAAQVATDDQLTARLLVAALDDIAQYRKALEAIAGGDTMRGKSEFTHADVVLKYQQIARKALK